MPEHRPGHSRSSAEEQALTAIEVDARDRHIVTVQVDVREAGPGASRTFPRHREGER